MKHLTLKYFTFQPFNFQKFLNEIYHFFGDFFITSLVLTSLSRFGVFPINWSKLILIQF